MTMFKNVFQRHLEQQDAPFASGEPPSEGGTVAGHFDLPEPTLPDMPGAPASPHSHLTPPPLEGPKPHISEANEAVVPAMPDDRDLDFDLVLHAAEAHRLIEETQAMRHEPADTAIKPCAAAPAHDAGQEQPNSARTRLLGFGDAASAITDPLSELTDSSAQAKFPCGWLVVTKGPGRGASFALLPGIAQIGRGADQAISLDFGDRAISREQHAVVAYDPKIGKFYLGHGGKSNIIRLNDRPVLSTEEMAHGDVVSIGETVLRFAAFCDHSFVWDEGEN